MEMNQVWPALCLLKKQADYVVVTMLHFASGALPLYNYNATPSDQVLRSGSCNFWLGDKLVGSHFRQVVHKQTVL